MGTRVPTPEPPYGTDCEICTPDLFPVGKTPEIVHVYVSGIEDCGWSSYAPPNGQTFHLTQTEADPCIWFNDGSVWQVTFYALRPGHDYSFLTIFDIDGLSFFSGCGSVCPPDLTVIDNDQVACIGMYAGAGGQCVVSYFDVVSWLVKVFGLEAGKSLFNELFTHSSGDVVQKFCDRKQRTNIKIRFSP